MAEYLAQQEPFLQFTEPWPTAQYPTFTLTASPLAFFSLKSSEEITVPLPHTTVLAILVHFFKIERITNNFEITSFNFVAIVGSMVVKLSSR